MQAGEPCLFGIGEDVHRKVELRGLGPEALVDKLTKLRRRLLVLREPRKRDRIYSPKDSYHIVQVKRKLSINKE